MLAALAVALIGYQIVNLGAPPGAEKVEAVAINNRGEVLVRAWETLVVPWSSSNGETGESRVPVRRGYLCRAGQLLPMTLKERYPSSEPPSIEPLALNDLSVAVGWKGTGMPLFMSGLTQNDAIIWRGRNVEDLGAGHTSAAEGINNLGDVVGGGDHRAFARLRGRIVWLAPLSHIVPADPSGEMNDANQCVAVAINDRRQILLNSTYGKGDPVYMRPYLVDGNSPKSRPRPIALPRGCHQAAGVRIGHDGTVLAMDSQSRVPFLSKGKRVTLLRSSARVPVEVAGMNGRGDVVGSAVRRSYPRDSSPLLWRRGKEVPFPTFPGWKLQTATGINDKGQICGTGLHNGKTRAYLLNPGNAKRL